MNYSRLKIWFIVAFTFAVIAVVIRSIWQIVVIPTPGTMLIFIPLILALLGMNALFAPFFFIIYALLLPLLIAYGLFVITGILHTALMLVGGNRRGLDATFRVVAYTQSAQVFTLIPVLGVFIYLVYTPILFAIGFKESHQISTGKAVFAVLLPAIIVLVVGIIVAVMFIPLILSLIPQMMMQQQPPPGF